jgi:hypothetical protein
VLEAVLGLEEDRIGVLVRNASIQMIEPRIDALSAE